jgi:Domain of unknown function (DUF1707)
MLAIAEVDDCFEQGYIDQLDRDHRVRLLEIAKTAADIEPCLADLRAARHGRRQARIAEDDREAARRRLALHHKTGELGKGEYDRRIKLVENASTMGELEDTLSELSDLHARRQRRSERLTTEAERDAAVERLLKALASKQLTDDEYEARRVIVMAARTRKEIEVAFSGLDPERAQKQLKAAKSIGTGILRGGQTILTGMVLIAWATVSALIVLFWVILGIGIVIPAVLLLLVALFAMLMIMIVR